jgi:hypothetical protein
VPRNDGNRHQQEQQSPRGEVWRLVVDRLENGRVLRLT